MSTTPPHNVPRPFRSVSASQVSTYLQCPRKWYFEKILGIRTPPTTSQILGTAIHRALEDVVRHGPAVLTDDYVPVVEQVDPAEIRKLCEPARYRAYVEQVQAVLPEWPTAFTAEHVEAERRVPTYDGGPDWVMRIDLHRGAWGADWKTSKSLGFVPTPEEALAGPQVTSYMHALGAEHFALVYLTTRGVVRAQLVAIQATKERVTELWSAQLAHVRAMEATAAIADGPDCVPGNLQECKSPKGECPHLSYCGAYQKSEEELIMAMLRKVGKKPEEIAATMEAAAQSTPPVDVAPEPPAPVEPPTEKLTAKVGPRVYVDCYPIHGGDRPVPLSLWLAPLMDRVASIAGVADYRLLRFGEGKAMLAAQVRENLDTLPACVLIESSLPGADVCLELLEMHASFVCKALRG